MPNCIVGFISLFIIVLIAFVYFYKPRINSFENKVYGYMIITNVRLVKAMVFPVVMYGCESWTIKKAECRRIDAFELWC